MNPTRLRLTVPVVLVLAAGGCALDWPEAEVEGFVCKDDSECVDGYLCADHLCVTKRVAVESVSPPDGAFEVHPAEVLRITFNKAVDAAQVAQPGRFTLKPEGAPEPIPVNVHQVPDAPEVVEIDPEPVLDYGRVYIATLAAELPSTIGETLAMEYVWSFRVANADWQPAEALSPGDPAPRGPAVGAWAGRRTVAWIDESGAIVLRKWEDAAWTEPVRLEQKRANTVAVGARLCQNERPCLVWESGGNVLARFKKDGAWDEDEVGVGGCADPSITRGAGQIAFRRNGNAVQVSWTDEQGAVGGDPLNDGGTTVVAGPVIDSAGLGSAVVWEEEISGDGYTRGMFWPPDANGREPLSLEVSRGSLRVTAAPGGEALPYWLEATSVKAAPYFGGLLHDPAAFGSGVSQAAAAIGARGGQLAWIGRGNIQAVHLRPPSLWRDGLVFADTLQMQVAGAGNLRIAVDDRDNAVLLWTENEDALWARSWRAHTKQWSERVRLDTIMDESIKISDLSLTVDDTGRGVAVWLEGGKVWAARFE